MPLDQPGLRVRRPNDAFQLKIRLLGIEPPIWRRIRVAETMPLPKFHGALQAVMGWTDSHLHQFRVGGLLFGEPTMEHELGPIDYTRVTLNQILPGKSATCVYEYDFGDGWEHLIEVEEEVPAGGTETLIPICMDGARACPPEDCGGPSGYESLLAAIESPGHPEHDEYIDWLGGPYDPEAFDRDRVNRALARLSTRPARRRRR